MTRVEVLGLIAFVIGAGLTVWLVEKQRRRTDPVPSGYQADLELPHEEPFEFYHNALSFCSMKTRLCLAELGIFYKSHHIDLIENVSYWRIAEGLLFHFDKMRPMMFMLFKYRGVENLPGLPPAAKIIGRSRHELDLHLGALEDQLAKTGGPWILGEAYTLADVSWLVIFERLRQANAEEAFLSDAERRDVSAYWERLKARPAYAESILGHSHPLIEYGRTRIAEARAGSPALRECLDGV